MGISFIEQVLSPSLDEVEITANFEKILFSEDDSSDQTSIELLCDKDKDKDKDKVKEDCFF